MLKSLSLKQKKRNHNRRRPIWESQRKTNDCQSHILWAWSCASIWFNVEFNNNSCLVSPFFLLLFKCTSYHNNTIIIIMFINIIIMNIASIAIRLKISDRRTDGQLFKFLLLVFFLFNFHYVYKKVRGIFPPSL